MSRLSAILLLALLALAPSWARSRPRPAPPPPSARVFDVHDGDTVRLESGQRVRLWGIDAPELRQAWGPESQRYLAHQVDGQVVQLEAHGIDRYGRILAVVRLGGRSLNEELLAQGLAWWFVKYTPDERVYAQLEERARAQRVGLWAQARPVAPWDFRHPERAAHP